MPHTQRYISNEDVYLQHIFNKHSYKTESEIIQHLQTSLCQEYENKKSLLKLCDIVLNRQIFPQIYYLDSTTFETHINEMDQLLNDPLYISFIRIQLDSAINNLTQLKQHIKQLQDKVLIDLKEKQEELVITKKLLDKTKQKLNEKKQDLIDAKNKATEDLDNKDRVIASRTQIITDLNQKVSERDQIITDLNQDKTDLNQKVAKQDQTITDLNQDKTNLNKKVAEQDQTITDLNQDIKQLNKDKTDLETTKDRVIARRTQTITDLNQRIKQLNKDKTDLETTKDRVIASRTQIITDLNQKVAKQDQTITDLNQDKTDLNKKVAKQDQTITDLNKDKTDRKTTKNQVIGDREQIITTRYQTILDLNKVKKNAESHVTKQKYILPKNVEKKTYLYNKINKIPEQQLTLSKKIINLIKQYLKNIYLINNQIWKLLFQQYSRIYFMIILCVINILFYLLLIKNFK
ncbi:MAG: hypothetical protein Q8760_01950 [Candidatus Phytoplasma australasiaticum]|nr:hypothetical protein [Candidatus Phytoplasma australasiaticum]